MPGFGYDGFGEQKTSQEKFIACSPVVFALKF
jgi:hypothetical protein